MSALTPISPLNGQPNGYLLDPSHAAGRSLRTIADKPRTQLPRMKILHAYKIFLPEINGGIPAVIVALLRMGRDVDNEIVVARRFGRARCYVFERAQVIAATTWGTLFSTPIAPSYPFVLHVRSQKADIVVHHMPFPLTDLGILIGLPSRTCLVVYWHADIVGRSILKTLAAPLIRRSLQRADKIVVSSEANAGVASMLSPYTAKVTVVPYGINTKYWMTKEPQQQHTIDSKRRSHPRLIVALGRLVHYKGYDILLQALTMVDATAVIIGEGQLRSDLETMARKLGVADRVTFAGSLETEQIKTWFYAARAFVLPSRTIAEAFGIVQIEAMATGLPVINTRLPTAVPLIARNDREGLTVEPDNAQELASAIRTLLDQPALAETLGAAGRARATAEYDETVFRSRMAIVYAEALKTRYRVSDDPGSAH